MLIHYPNIARASVGLVGLYGEGWLTLASVVVLAYHMLVHMYTSLHNTQINRVISDNIDNRAKLSKTTSMGSSSMTYLYVGFLHLQQSPPHEGEASGFRAEEDFPQEGFNSRVSAKHALNNRASIFSVLFILMCVFRFYVKVFGG